MELLKNEISQGKPCHSFQEKEKETYQPQFFDPGHDLLFFFRAHFLLGLWL